MSEQVKSPPHRQRYGTLEMLPVPRQLLRAASLNVCQEAHLPQGCSSLLRPHLLEWRSCQFLRASPLPQQGLLAEDLSGWSDCQSAPHNGSNAGSTLADRAAQGLSDTAYVHAKQTRQCRG